MGTPTDETVTDLEGKDRPGLGLTEATVSSRAMIAKIMFSRAIKPARYIAVSPFAGLKTLRPDLDDDWQELTGEQIAALEHAAAVEGPEWRNLVALTARAGLRVGEARQLKKSDVQFDRNRILVANPSKTVTTKKKAREVLLDPELAAILRDTFPLIQGELACPVPANNLYRTFTGYNDVKRKRRYIGIVERAGLPPYAKPFHTLRKNRATSWRLQYPDIVVDRWLGHGPEVARKHYTKVQESFYNIADKRDELATLRAENVRLKAALTA
jgi:integrase